jgi:fibronectin type 3 domain-containing protein
MTLRKRKKEQSREVDILTEKTSSFVKGTYKYISKKKVSTLRGLILIAFVAGIIWAVFFIASSDKFVDTKASTGSAVLSWNANTETDLAGYKIYYGTSPRTGTCPVGSGYPSSIKIGKVTSYTVNNLTEGSTYYFSVSSLDNSGNESCFLSEVSKSIPIEQVADIIAPAVSITSPANNTKVAGAVLVQASASDNIGVTKVEFYLNGALKSASTTSPYNWNMDSKAFSDGSYALTAKAYDAANNVGTSSAVTVNVSNAAPAVGDTIAPVVTIVAPSDGSIISRNMKVNTKATDNVGVSSMRALVDGTQVCSSTTGVLSCALTTKKYSKGAHTIMVEALDAANNKGTSTVSVTLP